MTARRRALVQRPGRKAHLATIAAGDAVWLTVCDRDVPVFGATVIGGDWLAWLSAAHGDAVDLCARCRVPLLVAALALDEVEDVRAAVDERNALAEQVRSLTDAVRRYGARILSTPAATSVAAAAAARREARVDRRLKGLGL